MNTAITYVALGLIVVFLLWLVIFAVLKQMALRRLPASPMGVPEVESAGQLAFSWAITLGSIILAGLALIIAGSMKSSDMSSQIMSFVYVYGGIICTAVFLPLVWLMVRNKQLQVEILQRKVKERELEAEVIQRMTKEKELEESNTRLSHAIEELRTAQRQLIESERMKALGEMASGIAHDFNNSLMPIVGLIGLMLNDKDALNDPVMVRQMLRDVHEAANDAKEIVRRLKEFYKHKDGAPHEPVDLNQIATSSVGLTKPRWQTEERAKGHYIDVKVDLAKIPVVMGNESQIREALINLILNAVDAIPGDGTITLRTFSYDKWVALEVADTGTGMNEATRQRCLEPFYTTKKQGTGLGLSMVLGIVRRHNGEINVRSELGKGTAISLRFPRGTGTPVAGEAAEAPGTRFDGTLNVLAVDDDARVQDTIKRFLEAAGHNVELAQTAAEALDKYGKADFGLVILDRSMPDMGGDKLAETIRKSRPKMPIIMLTGFGGVIGETPEAPHHVDMILGKPISYRELQAAIAEVMLMSRD